MFLASASSLGSSQIVDAGVVTVGYASVEGEKSGPGAQNTSSVAFGVTLTLLGQVVQAAQARLHNCAALVA